MKLQTIVDIAPSNRKIGYEDSILMTGSCFADSIGEQMEQRNLRVTCNPFGTLYNPLSIAQALTMTDMPELIEHDGLWHSMAHHGLFSRADKDEAEQTIRASIETMQKALREATVVIVTFGTAWVYEWKGERVVGNCHKMPETNFTRRRLTAEEIVAAWKPLLERYSDKHRFAYPPYQGWSAREPVEQSYLAASGRKTDRRSRSNSRLFRIVRNHVRRIARLPILCG